MRLPATVVAVSVALAVAFPAPALVDPDPFNDLIAELNVREAALPLSGLTKDQKRQRTALRKSFTALGRTSKNLTGDLVVARKMTAATEKGFPGDATFAAILDAMHDDLSGSIATVRDELAVSIFLARVGKHRDRAQAKLDAADLLMAGASSAATQALRARVHQRSSRTIDKGAALALKAGPGGSTDDSSMYATVDGDLWQANSEFGAAVTGIANVSEARGNLRKLTVTGRRILPSAGDSRLPGDTTRIQVTLLSNNADILPGVYGIGTVDGVNGSASWFYEYEDGTSGQATATSGTIELTSVTVQLGSVDAAGTFSLTMYDPFEERSFVVSGGAFDVSGIPRENVP